MDVHGWRWQAPPGWPAPPPGWDPPPGWQPDPSWPAPPTAWRWWAPAPRGRWQKVRLAALATLPVAAAVSIVALMVTVEALGSAAGCGSIDPTDPQNYSVVHIRNDTTSPVALVDCRGTYCHVPLPVRLRPGQQLTDGAACGASGSDMTSWKLTRTRTGTGTVLGYIAVDTPRKRDGLTFDVSRASPDRRTPTPAT